MDLDEFIKEVHAVAISKGWYFPPKTPVEALMLVVSELSEAVEEIRTDSPPVYYGDDGKPEGQCAEIADAIIRLLDYCAWMDLPIGEVMEQKNAYNKTRPYRHGGKKL